MVNDLEADLATSPLSRNDASCGPGGRAPLRRPWRVSASQGQLRNRGQRHATFQETIMLHCCPVFARACRSPAEQGGASGDLDVHYNGINSSFLQPNVAMRVMVCSKAQGVINVKMMEKGAGEAATGFGYTDRVLIPWSSAESIARHLQPGAVPDQPARDRFFTTGTRLRARTAQTSVLNKGTI